MLKVCYVFFFEERMHIPNGLSCGAKPKTSAPVSKNPKRVAH